MARGKRALINVLDEAQLIRTGEETGNIPFFIIDKTYGVAVDSLEYMVVEKKDSSKAIKNGNKIASAEVYTKWMPVAHVSTFEDALISYYKIKSRDLDKQLHKSKDLKDVLQNRKKIEKILLSSLSPKEINKEIFSTAEVVGLKEDLMKELVELKNIKEKLLSECNSLMELIKDKRRIIIQSTEPKKHRIKQEQ